jgi:hypothetical protein
LAVAIGIQANSDGVKPSGCRFDFAHRQKWDNVIWSDEIKICCFGSSGGRMTWIKSGAELEEQDVECKQIRWWSSHDLGLYDSPCPRLLRGGLIIQTSTSTDRFLGSARLA